MELAQDTPKNVQHNNAQNAVLFEAISLAIHLDTESSVISSAANLLARFILSKETNVRYLGLDTMAHLAARSDSLEAVKKHQDTVIFSLKDRDVSVRRRALDLLYSMCDGTNAKTVVGELLKYLSVADYTLREEMVLKIAILTEKFATEYEWYFDTILRLMSTAGDYVGEEVWYRIVQIVTNTEELQEYAARRVYEYLRTPTCHENIVKVASYILGEYGHLIAAEDDERAVAPIEQFTLVNSKISICSPATKALILTTYIKWLNLFPEIRPQILAILRKFTHTLDAEIQQRAVEYLAVASLESEELLQVIVDEMPPFPEQRESALLSRLIKKHSDTGDKRTWLAGGREVNKDKDEDRYKGFNARRKAVPEGQANGDSATAAAEATIAATNIDMNSGNGYADNTKAIAGMDGDIMSGLAGLDLSGPSVTSNTAVLTSQPPASLSASTSTNAAESVVPSSQAEAPLLSNGSYGGSSSSTPAPTPPISSAPVAALQTKAPSAAPPTPAASAKASGEAVLFTHGAERWLSRLSYNAEGVLFEDSQLQVGLKSEYNGSSGRIALFLGNKISVPFSSFTVTVESQAPEALSVVLPKLPPSNLNAATQVQQTIQLECKGFFAQPPILRISYLAGSLQTITLRLPVWINKFVEGVSFSQVDFFERWKQIGGPPREAQAIFPIRLTSAGGIDFSRNRKVIKGLKLGILDGIDPKPNNIVAAGVFHSANGKVGCLLRLEPNSEAKVGVRFWKERRRIRWRGLAGHVLRASGSTD